MDLKKLIKRLADNYADEALALQVIDRTMKERAKLVKQMDAAVRKVISAAKKVVR